MTRHVTRNLESWRRRICAHNGPGAEEALKIVSTFRGGGNEAASLVDLLLEAHRRGAGKEVCSRLEQAAQS